MKTSAPFPVPLLPDVSSPVDMKLPPATMAILPLFPLLLKSAPERIRWIEISPPALRLTFPDVPVRPDSIPEMRSEVAALIFPVTLILISPFAPAVKREVLRVVLLKFALIPCIERFPPLV